MTASFRKEVEHESELKCPVCEKRIPVTALIDVVSGSTRKVGNAGFNKPVVSVIIHSEVVGFKIEHHCDYKKPEGH